MKAVIVSGLQWWYSKYLSYRSEICGIQARLALNYVFKWHNSFSSPPLPPSPEMERWNLH